MSKQLYATIETESSVATFTGLGFASESSSELQQEYQKFFRGKLAEYEVESPAELNDEQSSAFFEEVKEDWSARKKRLGLDA